MKRIVAVFAVLLACLSYPSSMPHGTTMPPALSAAQDREPSRAEPGAVHALVIGPARGSILLRFISGIGERIWLCSFGAWTPRLVLEAQGDTLVLEVDFWTPIGRIQPGRFR